MGPPVVGNNGAGGNGLCEALPYLEDGVPGLGLPLISAGSYGIVEGGRLGSSADVLEGVHGLVGEAGRDVTDANGNVVPVTGANVSGIRFSMDCARDKGSVVDDELWGRSGEVGL